MERALHHVQGAAVGRALSESPVVMSNPPKKTRTQPGLGEGGADAVPRLNSAEMERVRRSAPDDAPPFSATSLSAGPDSERTPPPAALAARPRLRDSVRREDPDEPSTTREEEVFKPRPSVRQQSAAGIRRDSIRQPQATAPGVRDSVRRDTGDSRSEAVRPRIRDSVRREDPEDPGGDIREEQVSLRPPKPASGAPPRRSSLGSARFAPERDTGTRAKPPTPSTPSPARSLRPPVTVDEVGATALKIARSTRREGAPKLVASRAIVARAPIDTRSAFVLSLVDGRNTVDAIVDMAGMPADEVKAILGRLARLGLIELP